MSNGIRLSPQHGVNPSLDLCFWCGKERGVVLCGRIHAKKGDHSDVEAPKGMVTSLEPCEACKKKFATGIHMIEVSDDSSRFGGQERFGIKGDDGKLHWPTGRWAVLPPDAIKGGKAGGVGLCDQETMDLIYLGAKKERA